MSASIAAVVPVGYLDRHGYQHVWPICERNLEKVVDLVFVMQTIPGLTGTGWAPSSAQFARKPDGSFWFDAYTVMEAVNDGIGSAKRWDCDAAIVLMCNNYIIDPDLLYQTAEKMLVHDWPFAYYYRADQLSDQLFGPSVRLPWLVNLRHSADLRFSVDCLVANGDIIRMERGDWDEPPMVCDVQLEMTREDLAEKMNFIRCYSDLVPKRSPVFDWGYWFPYYVGKFQQKQRRPDLELTETGKQIAAISRPDFVSHEVLKCLG